MVELSRSSSFFLLSALLVLDLGETFLGLFLFSLTTLSRSLTHTHTFSSSVFRVAGKAASCSDSLAAVAGEAWICIDLDPVRKKRVCRNS